MFDVSQSPCVSGTNFILSAVATNVFGDSPVSNYSIMVIEGKTCTDSFLPCEKFPSIWIRTLGSLLLLMLILFIVSFVVTVFTIKSKQRLQREIQQSHACRDSDMTGTKVIYEEVELNPQPAPPTVIHTEENIAYANTSGNK